MWVYGFLTGFQDRSAVGIPGVKYGSVKNLKRRGGKVVHDAESHGADQFTIAFDVK